MGAENPWECGGRVPRWGDVFANFQKVSVDGNGVKVEIKPTSLSLSARVHTQDEMKRVNSVRARVNTARVCAKCARLCAQESRRAQIVMN